MIELTSSTGKQTASLCIAGNSSLPKSRISILRNPLQAGDHKHEVDSELESLIRENIAEKVRNWRTLTLQIRAFVNSLSEENQRKFLKIVKAFNLDKNKHLFAGEIWSGGGMRAIAGSGIGLVLSYIKLLAGLNYGTYIATSAGAFQAASRAFDCTGSQNLNATIEAPFHTFPRNRANLERWSNDLMRDAYQTSTGIRVDEITVRHLREMGRTFDVIVGEATTQKFPHRFFSAAIYPILAKLEERFGICSDELPLKRLLGATTNLPGLIFDLFDMTFGDCHIEDEAGTKHFFLDAGLTSVHRTPIHLMEEQIEKYRVGEIENPEVYFVMDYSEVTRPEIKKLKKEGGVLKEKGSGNTDWVIGKILGGADIYDWATGNDTTSRLRKLGTGRTYFIANCAAINPFNSEIAVITTGGLTSTPKEVRETVIGASIPLKDYSNVDNSVLDQLYTKFVVDNEAEQGRQEEFVSSNGIRGLSPYELIKRDIDRAIGKNQNSESNNNSRSMWNLRQLFSSSRAAAAL